MPDYPTTASLKAQWLEQGVLELVLNRTDAANALNGALSRALAATLATAAQDPAARAVILRGEGKVFCAGADLKERLANPGKDFEMRRPIVELWRTMHTFPKPLVMGINGHALGGGFELICHADAAIASIEATFALPEVNWAGIPGGWATQLLPRLVGPVKARWLMLSGKRFSATEAERLGIVSEVVGPADLVDRCREAATHLAAMPAAAVAGVKEATRLSFDIPLSAGVEVEDRLLQIATSSPERQERLAGFAAGKRVGE